ncbi:MAG: hypothetical protein JJ938_07010 [Roseicyclus sp.]|nr:hypothetical protein [Roseicyclus sp.]
MIHVPFERRFAPPSEEQLRDPDYLSIWGSYEHGSERWSDLNAHRCVVVLGEGKCGKTHEFKQQKQAIRDQGQAAFFIPLELLQDGGFLDAITAEEEQEFQDWLETSDAEAVFFLDAVDELKLRKGTLRRALRKIQTAVGAQKQRARFFVSCRPNDWTDELDLQAVASLVAPIERTAEVSEAPSGEEIFTAVIARDSGTQPDDDQETTGDTEEPVKVLALLPLSRNEIIEFARLYAADHADAFARHLEEKELWHLYQLPADIIAALDQLAVEGRLGNLQEQLVFGIGQRLREISDKKRNDLSVERGMEGAERIALALFLMKRRSIYFAAPGGDAEGVSVADILPDWSNDEQIELLGKSLFDPTGVGAVRFHHRSTQEFLAAQRLQKLREQGLATSDLHHLLFANIGEERVIIPSMEPVVAWLALWNPDILTEVKERNPLLLFRQGIPAILSLELRAELLRRFVERYSGSEWRRVGVGHTELKRVSTPELAPLVQELWDQAYTGHDTRELFLELVYLTPMADCADLAFQAAFDESLDYHHRTYAVWAVLGCGSSQQRREIGTTMVAGGWPDRVVRNALPDLFPEAIELEEFLTLARSLNEVPRSVHGLGYALLQAIKSDAMSVEQRVQVRDDLVDAIWANRAEESRVYQAHSSYDHFVDPVITACDLTPPKSSEEIPCWAWSVAVAFHFGERRESIVAKEETKRLQEALSGNVALREGYFWACFDLAETLEEPENDWQRFVRFDYGRILRPFTELDFPWLLRALAPEASKERRGVAFYALSMFVRGGENAQLAVELAELITDRADLQEELERILNPPPQEPDEHEIEHRNWQREREIEDAERQDGWRQWRQVVLASEDLMLGEADRENTLYNLYNVMQRTERDHNTWGYWDAQLVETAFSPDFLAGVREGLSDFWRRTDVSLFSELAEEDRNSYSAASLMALAALKCEAETANWVEGISHDEAVRATRISTLELNGFGAFLPQLEAAHPHAIEEVVGSEINRQLANLKDVGRAPILHDALHHGTPFMRQIAATAATDSLPEFENAMGRDTQSDLKYAFELIAAHGTEDAISRAVSAIQNHLATSNQMTAESNRFWLKMLTQLSLEQGCEAVLTATADLSTQEAREAAISIFAAIFGDRHWGGQPSFDGVENGRRLDLLTQLVIRAYQTVRPQEDQHHEGTFTPNTRDHAEEARGYLLSTLTSTKSPRTLSVLYELSAMPEFAHLTDRLKQMATELAANISEPEAMNASAFRIFDQERNYHAYDDPSLFAVMNHRLADFKHHLLNDEQTTVATLRKVEGETELRQFLSYWLTQNARSAYSVTQEAVAIAEKRTDIRLHAVGLDRYASVEAKLDDARHRWSGSQLRDALIDQLVGRYLNHERCRVGCLLICMRETRQWEHPDPGEKMDLETTVAWLQSIANAIMEARSELLLSVKGINYTVTANE